MTFGEGDAVRLFISTVFVAASLATPARAVTMSNYRGQTQTGAILELAPLRGIIGQPAVRGEALITPRAGIGGGYEAWSSASDRDDFTDHHTAIHMEGLFYPLGLAQYPVFVSAGLQFEQAEIGRQEIRRTTTWARTSASERYDRWVNRDTYYSLTESVGYRLVTDSVFTGSIRYTRDELFGSSSSNDADGILSSDPDMTTKGRPKVRQQIVLFGGLLLR